jgi:hypothetical protein
LGPISDAINAFIAFIYKRPLNGTLTNFSLFVPDPIRLALWALLGIKVPLGITDDALIISGEEGSGIGTDAMRVAFMEYQTFWALHAQLDYGVPEERSAAIDAEVVTVEEGLIDGTCAVPQGAVVELISCAILTGGGVWIPMEGCLAGHALSGAREVMLRKAHTDADESIEDLSASAFDA